MICSGVAFANQVGQAFAEGSVPIIKAYVSDNGSVEIKPPVLNNSKGTDIRYSITCVDLWGENWGDETLLQSNVKMDSNSETIWNNGPNGVEFSPEITGRIKVGESARVPIEITNLDAEYAKSLIGTNVYYCGITFEDAVIPYPEIEDEFIYDNKLHNPCPSCTLDSPYYLDEGDFQAKDACVYGEDGKPIPYHVLLKLKNGYVWENPTAAPDYNNEPYPIDWVIKKRPITPQWVVPGATWNIENQDCSLTYDGKAHKPDAPTASNLCEGHKFKLHTGQPDIYYLNPGPVPVIDVIDAHQYFASIADNGFDIDGDELTENYNKNYELEDNRITINVNKKDLEIEWNSSDKTHEYDGTTFRPKPSLDGVCSHEKIIGGKVIYVKDLVGLDYTYYKGLTETISDDNLPRFFGDYSVQVNGLAGDQAYNYTISGDTSFTFNITPRSSVYTSIN